MLDQGTELLANQLRRQRGDEVELVVDDGRLVVDDGRLTIVDEDEVRVRSSAAAAGLTVRAGTDRFARRDWRSLVRR